MPRRHGQQFNGLQKLAGRTRHLLETLAALVVVEGRGKSRLNNAVRREEDMNTALQREQVAPDQASHVDMSLPSEGLPCLTLFGEFSAGKSSLANLLVGTAVLPTSVLSTTRLPTRLRYAETLQIATVIDNGERLALDVDKVKDVTRANVREVEISLPGALLREIEILDTPGFADPYHDPQLALHAAARAHMGIWCTLASQAWRQTEQSIWKSMPKRLHETGLLVVTHCDTLRSDGDREQLLSRLRHEAGD